MMYDVCIVNDKLVVDEKCVYKACGLIEDIMYNKIRKLYDDKADEIDIDVSFSDECCHDECPIFWNEIEIVIYKDCEPISAITYTTDSYEPNLVYDGDKFRFYYVFTQSSNTCTNPVDLKNIRISKYSMDRMRCLEDVLIEELVEKLRQNRD